MRLDERNPLKSVALSPGCCTPSRRVFLADCGIILPSESTSPSIKGVLAQTSWAISSMMAIDLAYVHE